MAQQRCRSHYRVTSRGEKKTTAAVKRIMQRMATQRLTLWRPPRAERRTPPCPRRLGPLAFLRSRPSRDHPPSPPLDLGRHICDNTWASKNTNALSGQVTPEGAL